MARFAYCYRICVRFGVYLEIVLVCCGCFSWQKDDIFIAVLCKQNECMDSCVTSFVRFLKMEDEEEGVGFIDGGRGYGIPANIESQKLITPSFHLQWGNERRGEQRPL